jgi:hypothetical protein
VGRVVLVENGRSDYVIVIARDAIPSERYAAEELQRYLERISGARLPIVTDDAEMGEREIILGDNEHLRRLNLGIDFSKLGEEGFVLKTHGSYLIIAGGKPRGTLYGVYTFLEEKLGVRWFTPEVEHVPRKSTLEVPDLDETQLPAFEYREVFWTEALRDPDFAARHKLNGHHHKLAEKHGGRAVVFYPFVHSMDLLIPRELYREHPEYFPMISGKRVDGYVQRCLSNPEVVKLAIERVKQWVREHPEANVIDVSQNDTGYWCQCPSCKALDDAEGSPSASIIRFVNAIAEAIEGEHPHVKVETLAYQYSRKPPRTLKPRHNVIIRLCTIECCFGHPLATCPSEENRRFREDLEAWRKIAPTLYIWDYTTNFAHYLQPFPNLFVLQENIKYYAEHGVKGVFAEGNYSPGGNGEMAALKAYILAKLLWNPNIDVEQHVREFLRAYYGRAAEPIYSYLKLLHSQVKENVHVHIYDPPTAPYLNDRFLEEAEKLFDEAERLAESEEVRLRVQVARLGVWYVKLATGRVAGEARRELLRRFLCVARKAGITHISEGKTLEEWEREIAAKQ